MKQEDKNKNYQMLTILSACIGIICFSAIGFYFFAVSFNISYGDKFTAMVVHCLIASITSGAIVGMLAGNNPKITLLISVTPLFVLIAFLLLGSASRGWGQNWKGLVSLGAILASAVTSIFAGSRITARRSKNER